MNVLKLRAGIHPWLGLCQLGLLCLGLVHWAMPVSAQYVESIYLFTNEGFTSLRTPRGDLTLGKDGALYGTTEQGGTAGFGSVFKITTEGVLTVIANLLLMTLCG